MDSFKKEKYFAVQNSEDGVYVLQIEDIQKYLNDAIEEEYEFLDAFPNDSWDGNKIFEHDCDGVILIKGEIVVPTKAQVVTKYEI